MNKLLKNNGKSLKLTTLGFTLIELLGVLIVLAVIALITFPVVQNSIKNSQEKALESSIAMIEEAAHRYSVENDIGYPEQTNKGRLMLLEIQNKGFLEQTLINPINDEELNGCVWYYYDEVYNQYIFEYDDKCSKYDTTPTISIEYNSDLINSNGWAKEDIPVTILGQGNLYYCIASSECEPNIQLPIGNNTEFINTEGNNYLCAISKNSLGSSDKECINVKLDKTMPTISGIEDIIVDQNATVNLKEGINYSDGLSGIEGELTIEPATINTSIPGTKRITYKVSDKAGNVREIIRNIIVEANGVSVIYNLVDDSVINSNGWAKNNFYVRATINDNSGSGIKSAKSCVSNSSSECSPTTSFTENTKDFYIEVEGSNRICIEVTNNNNKTANVCSDTYKLDKTLPTAGTANFTGTLGSNDWYISDVTATVTDGTDSLSGHSNTNINITSITDNTSNTEVIVTTTDLAGNTATRSYNIKIDKGEPTITAKNTTVSIDEGNNYTVSNYFTINYSVSGGSVSCSPSSTGSLSDGRKTASCTVTGGNGKTATASITIVVNEKEQCQTGICNSSNVGETQCGYTCQYVLQYSNCISSSTSSYFIDVGETVTYDKCTKYGAMCGTRVNYYTCSNVNGCYVIEDTSCEWEHHYGYSWR